MHRRSRDSLQQTNIIHLIAWTFQPGRRKIDAARHRLWNWLKLLAEIVLGSPLTRARGVRWAHAAAELFMHHFGKTGSVRPHVWAVRRWLTYLNAHKQKTLQ